MAGAEKNGARNGALRTARFKGGMDAKTFEIHLTRKPKNPIREGAHCQKKKQARLLDKKQRAILRQKFCGNSTFLVPP